MQEFNAEECPLDGINLVEASAGTGKTYNIQLLVLRLLLEKKVPLQKILVVTFTVFATAELMSRLHSILLLTSRAFDLCRDDPDKIQEDEFGQVRKIVEEQFIKQNEERRRECVELIAKALADFDQASVMTIHGFCQRMLVDNAFASNVSFGVELKESIGDVQHEIAMDFMRIIRCSTQKDFILGRKLDKKITADWLLDKLGPALANSENGADICWRTPSGAPWKEQLEALNDAAAGFDDEDFKPDGLGPCFLAFYREHLAKLKAEGNFFTFDDLIRIMAEVVKDAEKGAALQKAIRENYQYAFVDEFQDTDPLQYSIFSKIFGGAEGENRGFFMIGDPKQAIYSFRGGDIFAYKKARDEVSEERRYTLSKNFRSSKKYIKVLNEFFGDLGEKFPVPEILFGGRENRTLYKNGVPVDDLLQFEQVETAEIGNVAVDKVVELLSGGYTLEPEEAEGTPKGEGKKVSASEIAILFPSKRRGAEIEALLNRKGIDTIWMSDSDIFQKPEAKALYDLLKMLYEGCSFPQLISVLAGDLFQCTAKELCKLQNKEQSERLEGVNEEAQTYFLGLRKTWETQGFYVMFRKLMFAPNSDGRQWLTKIRDDGRFEDDGTLAQHLISCDFIDGRYELGRLRQLGEILHQAEQARQLTPGRLLAFLLGKIEHDSSGEDGDDTAALIQRSTDLDAVRLLTLHSSKGLQFPIVIIPFFITHVNWNKPSRLFHKDPDNTRSVDMTGWSGEKRDRLYKDPCESERLDEKMRLLYVGLTRARYFCHLPYSGSKGVDVQFRARLPLDDFPATHEDCAAPATPDGSGAVPVETDDKPSRERRFGGRPVWDGARVSFSNLIVHDSSRAKSDPSESAASSSGDDCGGSDEQLSADDGTTAPTTGGDAAELRGDAAQESIFAFRLGSEAGKVWHEIFEKMDFDPEGLSPDGCWDEIEFEKPEAGKTEAEKPEAEKECEAVLKALEDKALYPLYRYIRNHKEEDGESRKRDFAFARMLKGILYNPMGQMDDPDGERFQLRRIPADRRAGELKFMFVLKENVTSQEIKECLGEKYPIGTLMKPVDVGHRDKPMIGIIDLLCRTGTPGEPGKYYIIDWKSNHLNFRMSGFDRAGMAAEVEKKSYSLQFLIYTVALWHFLKARQNIELTEENYDRYFGGVLYLFVRGIAAPLRTMSDGEKKICRERGIYFERPEFALIKKLKEMLEIRPLTSSAGADQTRKTAAEEEK